MKKTDTQQLAAATRRYARYLSEHHRVDARAGSKKALARAARRLEKAVIAEQLRWA